MKDVRDVLKKAKKTVKKTAGTSRGKKQQETRTEEDVPPPKVQTKTSPKMIDAKSKAVEVQSKLVDAQKTSIPQAAAVARCHKDAKVEVEKWARRALDKGVSGLLEEFAGLKRYVPSDMQIGTFSTHWEAGRNRYKDVPCQDKYRVVLKWPGQQHDYIHANYIATPINEKRFICTQGPLDSTIVDFWHMTIQEETETLIMLCNIKEKGMDKCAQYWPLEEKETKVYGDVEVTNTLIRSMSPEETSVKISVLNVKWQEGGVRKEREIRHYQWIDWPDRGVPPCRLTAMVLLSFVRGTKKPIIVHCSAGIGRTGTIVAIEFILERLQQGITCEAMDVILKDLRNQRPYSIQTDLQYLFVHRVMLFYFLEKYKVGDNDIQSKYKKFVEDYEKATA